MGASLPPPKPDDCIGWITIKLHAGGGVSIAGTIGQKKMAHQLLDAAKDAITRQIPDDKEIVVPNRDVEVVPYAGLKELGDIPKDQHGDS